MGCWRVLYDIFGKKWLDSKGPEIDSTFQLLSPWSKFHLFCINSLFVSGPHSGLHRLSCGVWLHRTFGNDLEPRSKKATTYWIRAFQRRWQGFMMFQALLQYPGSVQCLSPDQQGAGCLWELDHWYEWRLHLCKLIVHVYTGYTRHYINM